MNRSPFPPLRVRTHTGEIKLAQYDEHFDGKEHFVVVDEQVCIASSDKPSPSGNGKFGVRAERVRFVYPIEYMPAPETKLPEWIDIPAFLRRGND